MKHTHSNLGSPPYPYGGEVAKPVVGTQRATRKWSRFVSLCSFLAVFGLLVSCSPSAQKSSPSPDVEYYTCPMHPEVRSDNAGKCPSCGMDLVPKHKELKNPVEGVK
jgi:hypothetical protein